MKRRRSIFPRRKKSPNTKKNWTTKATSVSCESCQYGFAASSTSLLKPFIQWFLLALTMVLWLGQVGCGGAQPTPPPRLTIGLVSYDDGASSLEKYQNFQTYLAEQLQAVVELEPVFNEIQALEKIQGQDWSLVFAPTGLATIAMADAQYVPLFPLQGVPNQKSLLVVQANSAYNQLGDLMNQPIALGEVGSATGYYLPLYDLYGLTLSEVRFAPTPQASLAWVADGTVAAGALSEENFEQYRNDFPPDTFRILHESRAVPPGAVLLSPTVERNQQQLIETAMAAAPATITADASYIPNAPPPDLTQLTALVDKVRPLESQVRQQPAVLTLEAETP
jgi:phosphonate transport system substrate-binding protein